MGEAVSSLARNEPLVKRDRLVLRKVELRDEWLVKHIVLSTNIQLRSQYYLTPQALALRREHPMQFESWVAEVGCRVIGMFELSVRERSLHIRDLRVHTSQQRRGYGSRILHRLNQIARNNKCTELTLCAVTETVSPAFLKKNGFIEQERVVSDMYTAPGGGPVSEITMVKQINY